MVWKFTLCGNILILAMLWLLSLVAITPTYNHLVQYAESSQSLPILTDFAIQVRSFTGIIPLIWAVLTIFFGKWASRQPENKRCEYLVMHTSLTLCLGLAMLIFFSLAGILPVLKIGAGLG